jgi:hypothetical protein
MIFHTRYHPIPIHCVSGRCVDVLCPRRCRLNSKLSSTRRTRRRPAYECQEPPAVTLKYQRRAADSSDRAAAAVAQERKAETEAKE